MKSTNSVRSEARKRADRAYYQRNRTHIKSRVARYYAKHRSERLAYAKTYRENSTTERRNWWKEYYRENRKSLIALSQKWRQENPDKCKAICAVQRMNRRARERNASGQFVYADWIKKVEFHGWRCFYCSIELDVTTLTIDHRKPLYRGGSNWISNLVPSCKSCNCSKGYKNERPKCSTQDQ